jgi:hypothetical protein
MGKKFYFVLVCSFLMAGCAQDAYIHKSGDTMNSGRWERDSKACKTRAEKKSANVSGTMRGMKKEENLYEKCLRQKGWRIK